MSQMRTRKVERHGRWHKNLTIPKMHERRGWT